MSDLDESGFDSGAEAGGGVDAISEMDDAARAQQRVEQRAEDEAALEAEAEAAYEAHQRARQQQQNGGDDEYANEESGLGADRAAAAHGDAGFSSDDDGFGAGGDHGGDESFAEGGEYDGEEEDGAHHRHGGAALDDPSSIHAPAGASAATNEAAARLARLLAADAEEADLGSDGEGDGDGSGDPHELEVRQQRRREIAELEAQLQQQQQRSGSSSKRSSAYRGGGQEEKEGFDERRASQRGSGAPSAKASHRSGVGARGSARGSGDAAASSVDALADELQGLEDGVDDGAFDDEDEGGSEYLSDEDGASGRGGRGRDDGHDSDDDVRTADDVARAKEEREHLIEVNKIRQRQIAQILEREKAGLHGGKGGRGATAGLLGHHDDKGSSGGPDSTPPEQLRAEYIKNLENLNLLWDELEAKRERAEEQIDRLTYKLDAADAKATELSDSFKAFKREVSKEARFSRTGKPIKLKRILAFEAAEAAAEREVARVRLRHINLLTELRVLEESVRTKERLAEGLHLIDFEQLKIENQTLNEKIEERNDELHKLKKKTTTTVQVLTHIKEKLFAVREENSLADAELTKLNQSVTNLRDQLTRTKHLRDEARAENQLLKQKQGFIGSDLLVSDFEHRKGDIDVLRAEVEALKSRWRALHNLSLRAASFERSQARWDSEHAALRQAHYATVKFGGTATNGGGGPSSHLGMGGMAASASAAASGAGRSFRR
jgi:hypothetical protein